MKRVFLLLISSFTVSASFAESVYTDTWINWSPIGKEYDVVCFSKKSIDVIMKNVRITQLNRKAFQFKDVDGEIKARPSKNCFFEQKDPHPVSRDELFEEIVSVKCNLNQIPFKDGDFRILGTNSSTTSIKRLRDGHVWILPTNDCTFTTQLPKKPMMAVPPYLLPQQGISLNSEYTMLPGQADQMAAQNQQKPVEPLSVSNPPPSAKVVKEEKKISPQVEGPKKPVPPVVVEPPKVRTDMSENPNGTIKTLINSLN